MRTHDSVAGVPHTEVQAVHASTVNKPAIEDIARIAHEMNRLWCQFTGDNSQKSWEESEDWQRQSSINGVNTILNNPTATPRDMHSSWLAEKQEAGWRFGEVKNPEKKEHPCFCEFDNLPWHQQAKDTLFFNVVTAMKDLIKTPELNAGDRAMGVTFNPGGDWRITYLKKGYAHLYNMLERFSKEQEAKPYVDDDFARKQVARHKALAQTHLEESKMHGIESITR